MGPMDTIGKQIGRLVGRGPRNGNNAKPNTTDVPSYIDPAVAAEEARKKLLTRSKRGREGTIFQPTYGGANLAGTA